MQHKSKFDQIGVKLVAIGNGNHMFAQGFIDGLPFAGEVYIDENSSVFKALELKRLSTWETMKRYFMSWNLLSFFSAQSDNYKSSNMTGDGQQTGGVFVVSSKDDKILYSFIEAEHEADAFANIDQVLKACETGLSGLSAS